MEFDLSQFDLEKIHGYIMIALAKWDELVEGVPADELPILVYLIGSSTAIVLWLFVSRILPSPFGRITWLGLVAILCTPTVKTGIVPQLVPACVAFVYGAATRDTGIILTSATLIVSVFAGLLFLAFLWERIKLAYIDSAMKKQRAQSLAEYEKACQEIKMIDEAASTPS